MSDLSWLSSAGIVLMATSFGIAFCAIFGLVPAYLSHVYQNGTAALVFSFGNGFLGLGGIVGNAVLSCGVNAAFTKKVWSHHESRCKGKPGI